MDAFFVLVALWAWIAWLCGGGATARGREAFEAFGKLWRSCSTPQLVKSFYSELDSDERSIDAAIRVHEHYLATHPMPPKVSP